MPIQVDIPTPLRGYTEGRRSVQADGADLVELLADLDRRYPGFRARLVTDDGKLRRFVNVYINDDDVRAGRQLDARLTDGDRVTFLAAMAGGA
ncbi:molybdopterin synthase sulfur carrier subunit [Microtetraspora sp. NBRC 13810]|uniref:MoaD/ThiS family protein n=1 Tax=Microtetraspora sp. NBRC 13810 TaxID=3030990 RepID=UPI0024A34F54|nr:MoaD/ThiS family protein [Microtetraspora sp. NBRC 13810]GLW05776.1 molybdopterin synthase sulfur carrier subunit [Microtetraspora sp. NBRC 13810]